jgi:hypothetical protein
MRRARTAPTTAPESAFRSYSCLLHAVQGQIQKKDIHTGLAEKAEARLMVKAALSKSVAQPKFRRMSIAAEKVAEVLALPEQDRAFLAHQLIASLDTIIDADAEAEWREVIERRSREIEEGRLDTRSEEEMLRDIRAKLDTARHK